MIENQGLLRDRRLWLALLLTLVIATYFWTQSRYPALNTKAMMGGDAPIAGIAFDHVVEILPGDGLLWDIAGNSLNWAYTNWKGMTFGVLFGACLLTLLSLVQRLSFEKSFANSALGVAIGTPLGVCTNCAAPIAQALHSAGVRLETTLSALIASPTLNVIVVSMTFALLPVHMAAIKLVAMLGFALFAVPLMTRFVFRREAAESGRKDLAPVEERKRNWMVRLMERMRPLPEPPPLRNTWTEALGWLARNFIRNLAFVVAVTVPLMLVAGFLGAVAITLIPFDNITAAIGLTNDRALVVGLMLLVALFALFLPVPITFDVILTVILINSGWPIAYAMPVLMLLGSFSVYSFMIIGRAISFRVAAWMAGGLLVVSLAGTYLAVQADKLVASRAHAENIALLANVGAIPGPSGPPAATTDYADLAEALRTGAVELQPLAADVTHSGAGTVSLGTAAYVPARAGGGDTPFARMLGSEIGLDLQPDYEGLEFFEPYTAFQAMAAGDIHGDGWTDIALADGPVRGGVVLYANRSGRFVRQTLDLAPLAGHFVSALAFEDLNNDGQPDLFASTYMHGAYVFWNEGGYFTDASYLRLPETDVGMIGAPAFADFDGDGLLDLFAGNWSAGVYGGYLESSHDRVYWNNGAGFDVQRFDNFLPGESLTALVMDVDGDGRDDVVLGDDMQKSDKVFLYEGERRFRLLRRSEGVLPYLTVSSMGLTAGDLDNDLSEELFSAQASSEDFTDVFEPSTTFCVDALYSGADAAECFAWVRDRSQAYDRAHPRYSRCGTVSDPAYRPLCAVRSLIQRAAMERDASYCDAIPDGWADVRTNCRAGAGARTPAARERLRDEDYLGGADFRNVLFTRDANGMFVDRAVELGVEHIGWAWSSHFVDLDQDGWQDLYVTTGLLTHRNFPGSVYYRNQQDGSLAEQAGDYGLADRFPTMSYLLLDYDRDGDLDVLRSSTVSEPIVQRNDRPAGGALTVRLVDELGNRAAVGARVTIHTEQADWRQQVRVVRQSGGFSSMQAPQLTFGLGNDSAINRIDVLWPDGARSTIAGPIDGDRELVITRRRG